MTVINHNSITGINSVTGTGSAVEFYDTSGNKSSVNANVIGNITGNVTGNITATTVDATTVKVGTAVTISAGVVTATSFSGDGSGLSGIDATTIKDAGGTTRAAANTSGVVVTGILTASSGAYTGNITMDSNDPTITMTDTSGTNDTSTIESLSGALRFTVRDGNADGEVIFRKYDGTTYDETLRITNTGKIGIGTNNPAELLDVEGNSEFGGRLKIRRRDSDTSAALLINNAAGSVNQHIFYGNGTVSLTGAKVQIDTNGNIDLRSSGGNLFFDSGKGISFADTADGSGTMTSELLDDYEEGTFTPTYSNGFAPSGTPYAIQSGRYTKIGNVVYFQLQLQAQSGSVAATQLRIGGLPFNANLTSPPYGGAFFAYQTIATTTSHIPTCMIVNGTNNIYLYKVDGNFWNANDGAGTVVGREVRINGFYHV